MLSSWTCLLPTTRSTTDASSAIVLEMTGDVHLTDQIRTYRAGKQTLLRGAEREEEPLATTTKRTTTGKCTGTDVVQHVHQRPARHIRRHSQLHLHRGLVHRVARKRLQQHRSVTHVCPEHYDYLLRHEPTACEPFKDTGVCFPPKEPISQTRTECSVERYQTLKYNNTSDCPVYLGIHLDRCAIKRTLRSQR